MKGSKVPRPLNWLIALALPPLVYWYWRSSPREFDAAKTVRTAHAILTPDQ